MICDTCQLLKIAVRFTEHLPTRLRGAEGRVRGRGSRDSARRVRGEVSQSRRECPRGGTCRHVQMKENE